MLPKFVAIAHLLVFVRRITRLLAHCSRQISAFALMLSVLSTAPVTMIEAAWLPSLSEHEQAQIQQVLGERAALLKRKNPANVSNHTLGLQVLLIERRDRKHKQQHDQPSADVFLFDYRTGLASVELIDLETLSILQSRVIEQPHFPLNQIEQQHALGLLRQNSEFNQRLSDEYQRHFAGVMPEFDQLDMKVSVWIPNPNQATSKCHESRCALVSIFTNTHFNFSTEPVVDLVSGDIFLDAFP